MKLEKGSCSQGNKPICSTYGKRNYGQCVLCIGSCFSCGKDGHKVRVCPSLASRGNQVNQVRPSVSGGDAPKKNQFYELQTKGTKPDEDGNDAKF